MATSYDKRVRRLITSRDEWRDIAMEERRLRLAADREVAWYRDLVMVVGAEQRRIMAAIEKMKRMGSA